MPIPPQCGGSSSPFTRCDTVQRNNNSVVTNTEPKNRVVDTDVKGHSYNNNCPIWRDDPAMFKIVIQASVVEAIMRAFFEHRLAIENIQGRRVLNSPRSID